MALKDLLLPGLVVVGVAAAATSGSKKKKGKKKPGRPGGGGSETELERKPIPRPEDVPPDDGTGGEPGKVCKFSEEGVELIGAWSEDGTECIAFWNTEETPAALLYLFEEVADDLGINLEELCERDLFYKDALERWVWDEQVLQIVGRALNAYYNVQVFPVQPCGGETGMVPGEDCAFPWQEIAQVYTLDVFQREVCGQEPIGL